MEPRLQAKLELVVEVLRRGNAQTIVAHGGSMTAAIRNGATITLAPVHALAPHGRVRVVRPPELGDVVAVATPRVGLVVHRVVGVDSGGRMLVKGDACPSPDGWFSIDDIAAVVVDVDGHAVPPPTRPPPRWRRGVRRLLRLVLPLG